MRTFDIGDTVRVHGTFTEDGAPVEPLTVVLRVLPPGAAVVEVAAESLGAGAYRADFSPTVAGRHHWRLVGSGGVGAAEEGAFEVRRQTVP